MIKVYIQYPWIVSDSPYYKYLIKYPPSDIIFNSNKSMGVLTAKRKMYFSNNTKRYVRRFFGLLPLSLPNVHPTLTNKYDVIHCAHCLYLGKLPWVVDVEGVWQLFLSFKGDYFGRKIVEKILSKSERILPWTRYTLKEMKKVFPNKNVVKKLELMYPAVPLHKSHVKKGNRLSIIYVSRNFWLKGGLISLYILNELQNKYDVDVIFVSPVNESIKRKFPRIKFIDLLPQEELFKLYEKADIFFYPSFVDTFGFALLEAMSFGLPIVTINTNMTKSVREIVEDGKEGFVIDVREKLNRYSIHNNERKLINRLARKTSLLIEDESLRRKMGRNGIKLIRNGKFSIKQRNKKLKKIYEEALKK